MCFCRLLDILAGRKDPAGLEGTLLLDGSPPPENFKCMVGYVVQVCSYIKSFMSTKTQQAVYKNINLCVYILMIFMISKNQLHFFTSYTIINCLPLCKGDIFHALYF